MSKRLLALLVVLMVAGFVSTEATRVAVGPAPEPGSVPERIARVALGGVVIALSPVGAMAGCGGGGGGPRPTSATAVALAESVLRLGFTEAPMGVGSGSSATASVEVADRRPVSDVAVDVRLSRSAAGRTRLALRHPDGTEVLLHEGEGRGLVASYDASARPELAAFLNRSGEGTWSLVASSSEGDARLDSWSLRLRVLE
jgi:hypothetical protein